MPVAGKLTKPGLAPTFHRRPTGSQLDGRTVLYRHGKAVRAALLSGLGPKPTGLQRMLVEEGVRLAIRVRAADNLVRAGEPMTARDSKIHSALANALTRLVTQLGRLPGTPRRTRKPKVIPPPPGPMSLPEYLATVAPSSAEPSP